MAQKKGFGLKAAVNIAAMSPAAAKKAIEEYGFTYLEDVPLLLGKKKNGDMSFLEMNTGRIVELDIDSKGKIFNLLIAYDGDLLNSMITLEMLGMDFKEHAFKDDEEWESGLKADALKNMNYEAYTKELGAGNKVWMFRASSKAGEKNEEQKFIVGLRYKPAENTAVKKDSVSVKAKEAVQRIYEASVFLIKNKNRRGVTLTETGLQYEVLKKGPGKKPALKDTVVIAFKGMLLNGNVFSQGQTGKITPESLIPGLTEGIRYMNEGSKYKFFLPSQLGYGSHEAQGIPANSLTIYEIELLSIKKK